MFVLEMNKKFKYIVWREILLLLVISICIFVVNLLPAKITSDNRNMGSLAFPKLAEKIYIKSNFVANANSLNRVDILFKNPNLESRDEVNIVLLDGSKIVADKAFTGFNFGDTSRARLDFDNIGDSKGKIFTIVVKTTKIIDGKLAVGIKGDEVDYVAYYQFKTGILSSIELTRNIFLRIIINQPIVLILPMILWGFWLW
jgi:hypothetical protein